MEKVNCRKMVCESRITGGFCMKNMKAILSILLAVVLLIGSVPVVVFASSESDGLALTEVEPTIDPRLPELFEQEDEPTEPE